MLGLFKKKIHTKDLLHILSLQNKVLEGLFALYSSLEKRMSENAGQDNAPGTPVLLDKICGEWLSRKLGICVTIKKYGDGYFAEIGDIERLPEDFVENYPIRLHKDMPYFVLDGHVISLEYDANSHEVVLCGQLSLLRKAADVSLYPGVPFDFNHN